MQLTEAEVDSLSNRIAPIKNSRNIRWDRDEYAEKVVAMESLMDKGLSERAMARELDVPRSTLQAWKHHRDSLDVEPEFIAFLESSLGLAFLHRLCAAAHLVFVEAGACGVAMVSKFLRLSCLDRFVACSVESQRQLNQSVQNAIVSYVAAEQPILQSKMPDKEITVCQDETFTGGLCLVAIEPESGFILLEKKAENRTCETWTAHMSEAMRGMKAKIIQSTSDEGKGLLAYAEHTLGVAHSPDIFHVQHELCKAVAAPVALKIRRTERAIQSANEDLNALNLEKEKYLKNIADRGPGRPKDFAQHLAAAHAQLNLETKELERLQAVQEDMRANTRGLGEDYHFLDPLSGERLSPGIVTKKIQARIDRIRLLAEQEKLSESSLARIDKAERVLPKITACLDFVSTYVRQEIDKLGVSPALVSAIHMRLLPAAYLERLAGKENKQERLNIEAKAGQLKEPLYAAGGAMTLLAPEQRRAVEYRVQQLAQVFQRSSSCVEGRNGVLAFRHHELHNIRDRKRLVLTALHNYFITRTDGTTAAERFFQSKPSNLFQAVLARAKVPARPLSPPRKTKCPDLKLVN
jgi:hypothetical protein